MPSSPHSRARLPVASAHPRTDWFRVIEDVCRAGYTLRTISHDIDVPISTLHGWKSGASPDFDDGQRLAKLWRFVMGETDLPVM